MNQFAVYRKTGTRKNLEAEDFMGVSPLDFKIASAIKITTCEIVNTARKTLSSRFKRVQHMFVGALITNYDQIWREIAYVWYPVTFPVTGNDA